ncbi:uncharacterized protein LY79DRAFT_548372 [Colletotrichum navitas]|uniref:Uncharacterized protein n=1 Tax=Colletotrichum navitas TaxID=681940 RepID=A0AAD8Q2L3_9PEZI|nr:uncharacterized protein LY79DRAFT_548372 [Colletotrichum navitas]KAK1594757.1 hypothetical protein LY79DRAFT_548372 [Colletotrichum navitas]
MRMSIKPNGELARPVPSRLDRIGYTNCPGTLLCRGSAPTDPGLTRFRRAQTVQGWLGEWEEKVEREGGGSAEETGQVVSTR